jgi:hypothetical protein
VGDVAAEVAPLTFHMTTRENTNVKSQKTEMQAVTDPRRQSKEWSSLGCSTPQV